MRKNILILNHNYATQFLDICNQYAKLFDPDKYKVTVAYLSGKPDEQAKARTLAEEVIFLDCSKKAIRGLKIAAIKKLVRLCRERNFSIVICHRYKPLYTLLFAAQFCQIPRLFFVMHAMYTMHSISRKLLIAALAHKNMYFAGVSNAVRDDLRKSLWRVPKEQIITLYNSIDVATTEKNLLSRSAARQKLNLPEDYFVFGTVGRLAPEKDQKNMLQAFAKIKPQQLKAKLILIGDGPLESELKQLAQQLNIQNEVIFAGFIPQAARYFKALDIAMLCSTKEAFGRSLLEAMVAHVPVIGSRTNGIPEAVGDAGIIVEARDSAQLAAAMQKILAKTSKEMAEWGERTYEHVSENFSIERFQKDFWRFNVDLFGE